MLTLQEIPGIERGWLGLLDGAGIRDAAHLAQQVPSNLVADLHRANQALGVSTNLPGIEVVEKWVTAAQEMLRSLPAVAHAQPSPAENFEVNHEVADMLERAPFAIPLLGKAITARGLRLSDVPLGLPLDRYLPSLETRADEPIAQRLEVPSRRGATRIEHRAAAAPPELRQFDSSRIKTAAPKDEDRGIRVPKSKEGHENDRVALLRAPLEKTNRGKDPNSRRYIRGVLHTHPWSLRLGAVFSLLLLLDLPLAIISAILLLVSRQNPGTFSWVQEWILAFPIALPVIGLGYMIFGFTGKCRICNQKLFVQKAALKHVKAHRFPGCGFVVPLCLHLLAFSWFRCSSCGTPVRLKK